VAQAEKLTAEDQVQGPEGAATTTSRKKD